MSGELHLDEVCLRHEGQVRRALNEVTLDVPPGRMIAVIGPSGSGKSTLLRVIAGLLRPDHGDIRLDARSLAGVPAERRGMSMMFQKPHLFPHLDVLDNVAFADRVAGRSRTHARASARGFLNLVHLRDLAHRRPRELSGGQEQRVALARALAARPEVLLLDEPFSALDFELRTAMHALLQEVRLMIGPTTVMVTHDLTEAALADTIAVLVDGEVVQHATADELYRTPASVTVARLLGGFSELVGVAGDGGYHCALGFVLPDDPRSGAQVTVLVRQEAVEILDPDHRAVRAAGQVISAARSGARQIAHVQLDPDRLSGTAPVVLVEQPPGRSVPLGARVGVRVIGPLVAVPVAAAAGHPAGDLTPASPRG